MNLKRYMLIWIFISILVDSLGEKEWGSYKMEAVIRKDER